MKLRRKVWWVNQGDWDQEIEESMDEFGVFTGR